MNDATLPDESVVRDALAVANALVLALFVLTMATSVRRARTA